MKKVLLLGVCLFTFSACSPDDGRLANALIGGAAGGIMGNTIGGGSGKTTASIGGAIIGTLVGQKLGQSHNDTVIIKQPRGHHHHYRQHTYNRPHVWTRVCKNWPRMIQNRWGNYRTIMIYECRMTKKARW